MAGRAIFFDVGSLGIEIGVRISCRNVDGDVTRTVTGVTSLGDVSRRSFVQRYKFSSVGRSSIICRERCSHVMGLTASFTGEGKGVRCSLTVGKGTLSHFFKRGVDTTRGIYRGMIRGVSGVCNSMRSRFLGALGWSLL